MAGTPEPPIAGDDAATMLGSLERQRATFAWKCSGVDDVGLKATVAASSLSLAGLLLHLAFVEDLYFSWRLGGANLPELWPEADLQDEAGAWVWSVAEELSGEVLLERWQGAVRRSRAVVTVLLTDGDLDQLAAHSPWEPKPSLRRTLADLVEEYARHVGHADLLREAVDGETGEDPPPNLPGYPTN